MKAKHVRIVAVGLLILGVIGFLFASIGLASADKVTDIQAPAGMQIVLSPDDPQVKARHHQAEMILMGSLVVGGCGVLALGLSFVVRKR